MSSQVISETCGMAMYKGRQRFSSILRLGETLVLDEVLPVNLIILVMVNKASHLVITTSNSAFGEPFGSPEKALERPLWTRNLRLKLVSAPLQLPIQIHTNLKTVLPDARHSFKGTFPSGEELGVSIMGSFALAEPNTVSVFAILWFISAWVSNIEPICLKFLNEAPRLLFTSLNVVKKC